MTEQTTPKIAVTFDIGYLAQLALAEAQKMEFFKDKNLTSKCVFMDNDGTYFEGIEVSTGGEG